MKQLLLLPSPKPLRDRLGETFFRSVPRCPGVYIMTGEEERVLYIGQSKNLRARLATYKNATRDRSPRKVVQLVHQVRNVVWEKCDSSEASKTREAALLRVHRPKFNVIGTWQLSPRYVVIRASEDCLELDCTTKAPTKTGRTVGGEEAPMERQVFGPFKSSVIAFYGVFLRLIWSAVNLPDSPAEFPAGFFSQKPPHPFRVWLPPKEASRNSTLTSARLQSTLANFFESGSADFVALLKSILLAKDGSTDNRSRRAASTFQLSLEARDFELLDHFQATTAERLKIQER